MDKILTFLPAEHALAQAGLPAEHISAQAGWSFCASRNEVEIPNFGGEVQRGSRLAGTKGRKAKSK